MARFYKLPDGTKVPADEYEGNTVPQPETPNDDEDES